MNVDPAYAELLGKMDALRGPQRKLALKKSLRAIGNLVKDVIVATAPIQAGVARGVLKPGELKDDFRVSVHVGDDGKAAEDTDRVRIGPSRKTVDIAIDVETGHDNRPRNVERSRARVERTPAHPFVRPAFDASKEAAIFLFEETMGKEIKKVMDA